MNNCTAPECTKPRRSRRSEYCEMHYFRLRRKGTLTAHTWHRRGTCSVVDCGIKEFTNGLCSKHDARVKRTGTIEGVRPRRGGLCSFDACDRPHGSRGYCDMHARRDLLNGSPHIVKVGKPPSGPDNSHWVGDDVSYEGWHSRIRKARGSAALHPCADCGLDASDWSYNHCGDDERMAPEGPYSLDMAHYSPRCRRCHIIFDLAHTKAAAAGRWGA